MAKRQLKNKILRQDTLYVWDLAQTLFREDWDSRKTGAPTYGDWLARKLDKKFNQIKPREYEMGHRTPYRSGWHFNLDLQPGFKEVLSWTKHNEVFTTGVPQQIGWRAEYLGKKYGFDLKKYFQKINSTFDYGETNVKTEKMLADFLKGKFLSGYRSIVYVDDRLDNLRSFRRAVAENRQSLPGLAVRLYHILNDVSGCRTRRGYFSVGTLYDLLDNEKKIINNH